MKIMNKINRLERILHHAYTTTPFYMDSDDDYINDIRGKGFVLKEESDWEKIPLTKKEDIVLHKDSFISSHYLSLYLQEKLLQVSTSGSTGKCVEIYWSKSDNNRSLMPLWLKRKRYYQINPHDRHCYFYTGRKLGETDIETEDIGYARGFCKSNLNEKKLVQIWYEMIAYNPIWFVLQPSMGALLAKVVETYNLPMIPNLRYIEMSGEMLLPAVREQIERVLHVRIANQYGCVEMNSIAYECSEGYLHCMEENVFTEILDDDGKAVSEGEEGNIYITTLLNYAMPLIRYQIGDRGRFVNQRCDCGNHETIMELSNGRNNDWVIDNNGEYINAYIFIRCITNTNIICENAIYQFQVIQHEIGRFSVNLVIDDEFPAEKIRSLFLENLWQTSLSGAAVHFNFHPNLYPDSSIGKLKWFINEMNLTEINREE